MKTCKRLLQLSLITIFLAVSPELYALVMGVTKAEVKVRETPNGPQTDLLKAGTPVGILDISSGWAKVMYLSPPGFKTTKTGWVNLTFLQVMSGVGAGGDDCETEYKTNAEVCVEVSDTNIDCRKDYSGEYYRGCDVTVEYELTTNYSGGSYLDAEVECQGEIRYKGRGIYSWRSDSSSQDDTHNLYAHGSESELFTFDFSFSSLNEVTQVKIDSVSCEVESVNLW